MVEVVDLPVVLVGCPVQNREHTIEKYLKHIYMLAIRKFFRIISLLYIVAK